jgi:hypothetical protein
MVHHTLQRDFLSHVQIQHFSNPTATQNLPEGGLAQRLILRSRRIRLGVERVARGDGPARRIGLGVERIARGDGPARRIGLRIECIPFNEVMGRSQRERAPTCQNMTKTGKRTHRASETRASIEMMNFILTMGLLVVTAVEVEKRRRERASYLTPFRALHSHHETAPLDV